MAKAKTKKRIRSKDASIAQWAKEPTWDKTGKEHDFSSGLSWYHIIAQKKDKKKWLLDYMKQQKMSATNIKAVRATNVKLFGSMYGTYGTMARMLTRGCKLVPKDQVDQIKTTIKTLIADGKKIVAEKKKNTNVKTVQEYTREKIDGYIAELEPRVDELFLAGKFSDGFDPYQWFGKMQLKPAHCAAISSHFQHHLNEIQAVIEGEDEQLVEAYKFLSVGKLEKVRFGLETLVTDCTRWGDNNRKAKKSRKKKVVSVSKLVAKMKHKKDAVDWKLKSIDATKVIGAEILYVFNTKDRMLLVFHSDGPDGLSVKGTTLQGYDAETSKQRRLRKPEEVLPVVLSSGKRAINNAWKVLTTKETSVPSGRINRHMILLKVL